jgi:hypothetical protein
MAVGTRGPQQRGALRSYRGPRLDAKRDATLSRKLAGLPRVRAVMALAGEETAYMMDRSRFNERSVLELIAGEI